MVNRTSSILIGAVSGAVVGWVVGNIVADIVVPEFYSEEERVDYARKMKDWDYESATEKIMETGSVRKSKPKRKDHLDYTKSFKTKKQNLADLVKEIDDPEETSITKDGEPIDEETADISYEAYAELFNDDEIRLISQKEYKEDDGIVTQTELKYYSKDEVLTDDAGQPLDANAVPKTIGEEALVEFGRFSDDPNTVHVWNPKQECQYRIELISDSYEKAVLEQVVEVKNIFDKEEGDES